MKRTWIELGVIVTIAAVGMAFMRSAEATADADQDALYHFQLGARCYRQGEHRRAIGELSQALALKPEYRQAYRVRGLAWLSSGMRDRAQADFDRGLLHPPSPWESWLFTGGVSSLHLERARLGLVEGRFEESLKDAEQARSDHWAEATDVAACAKAGLGQWTEASDELHSLGWAFIDHKSSGYLRHQAAIEAHLKLEPEGFYKAWKDAGSPSPHGPEGACFLCRTGPGDE